MNGALGSVPSSLLPQQNRTGLSDEQAGKGNQGQGAWLLGVLQWGPGPQSFPA